MIIILIMIKEDKGGQKHASWRVTQCDDIDNTQELKAKRRRSNDKDAMGTKLPRPVYLHCHKMLSQTGFLKTFHNAFVNTNLCALKPVPETPPLACEGVGYARRLTAHVVNRG